MDTGDRLDEYIHAQSSDPMQFYAISTWQRTPHWRCEEWDANVNGYVQDALAGKLRGKWTPMQVSQRLSALARQTLASLDAADPTAPEFKTTALDLRILAALAQYHAAKTLAGVDYAVFLSNGDSARLPRALTKLKEAALAWERIVRLTDGIYNSNLVFGYGPEHKRREGHTHTGSWKDRLESVRADVPMLEALIREHPAGAAPPRALPGEQPLTDLPQIRHTPIASATPQKDLHVSVKVEGKRAPREVILHFRVLNQTLDWHEMAMQAMDDGVYQASIPAKEISPRWDLEYYFEVLTADGGTQWPSWETGAPYFVVSVR